MSKLQDQIKELQRKAAKIDLFQRIIDNLNQETKDPEGFPGLMKEVAVEVAVFCKGRISQIEGNREEPVSQKTEPVMVPKVEDKKIVVSTDDIVDDDPLKFIVKYKNWINQKVQVKNGRFGIVEGDVLGAAFPNLKVKVQDNIIIVNPKELTLLTTHSKGEK